MYIHVTQIIHTHKIDVNYVINGGDRMMEINIVFMLSPTASAKERLYS